MRFGRLVPAILQHLGDFPHRLAEHQHAAYDFSPIPPLAWPELESEMWCLAGWRVGGGGNSEEVGAAQAAIVEWVSLRHAPAIGPRRYYLRNLCDEDKYGGWAIVDHIPLLQVGGRRAGG